MRTIVEMRGVSKWFGGGAAHVAVLSGIDLAIAAGSFTIVAGPSGAGKSTLLHLMGGLERPTEGRVCFDGLDLAAMPEHELTLLRRRRLGFVFQFFNLLSHMAVWQNIALPLLLDGVAPRLARPAAAALAEELGIVPLLDRDCGVLSGGELQRAAVARALIRDPALVLADEPTGNLDTAAGRAVLALLCEGVRRRGRTLVMVTHDAAAWPLADRVVHLLDGRIVDE